MTGSGLYNVTNQISVFPDDQLRDDGGVCPDGAAKFDRRGVDEGHREGPGAFVDAGSAVDRPSDPFISRGRLAGGPDELPAGGLRGSTWE